MMARLTILEGPLGRFLNVYFLKSIMALYNFFFKKKKKLSCGSYCKEQSVGKDGKKKKKKTFGVEISFSFQFFGIFLIF